MTATDSIHFLDPYINPEYGQKVGAQVSSGFLGPGKATRDFSEKLAGWLGVGAIMTTVSGTVALTVAAKALNLKEGDEILVPGYGVISTINGLATAGLRPRLADIDRVTGCVSVDTLDRSVTSETRAVCFVNFSGFTGDNLLEVQEWCRIRQLPLIEDAACALGHKHRGIPAGGFGSVGCYSFSVPKVLTTGQGGALTANDPDVFERANAYIDQGDIAWRRTGLNRSIGSNLRFNDIQASLGLALLDDIEERQRRRRDSHAALRRELGARLYAVPGGEAPLHNIVFTDEAERLVAYLNANKVAAQRQHRAIGEHPAYHHLGATDCAQADWWSAKAVYLPFGVGLSVEQATRIADVVKASGVELMSLS